MIDPMDKSTMRAARRYANLTQVQLAERVGTTPNTIRRIESGPQNPSLDLWTRIVSAIRAEMEAGK
jgi:DNA-binding XRE family transcriptional regulator